MFILSRRRWLSGIGLAVVALILGCRQESSSGDKATSPTTTQVAADPKTFTVFAAASTRDVMEEISRRYQQRTGNHLRLNFASSGTLAKQIIAGAPADIFLSANVEWMDNLQQRGLIQPASRRNVAANRLVLITPPDKRFQVRFTKDFPIATAFEGRLAIGDPASVPAGTYAKAALEHLGWYATLQDRLAPALDVRAALMMVERGEVGAGIVYATDAKVAAKIETVAVIPETLHEPIRYPAALCQSASADANDLLAYLTSADAQAVWTQNGFLPPTPTASQESVP